MEGIVYTSARAFRRIHFVFAKFGFDTADSKVFRTPRRHRPDSVVVAKLDVWCNSRHRPGSARLPEHMLQKYKSITMTFF